MAKIKIKSNRAAAKRFKARGNGYKYRHAFKSHILTKKTTKRRRNLRQMEQVSDADAGHISRMCPYL